MLKDSFFIRKTHIRNRICVPPMVCYHWTDESGVVSDRHVEHYRAMARGGARRRGTDYSGGNLHHAGGQAGGYPAWHLG